VRVLGGDWRTTLLHSSRLFNFSEFLHLLDDPNSGAVTEMANATEVQPQLASVRHAK